jgi:hypothetical protein
MQRRCLTSGGASDCGYAAALGFPFGLFWLPSTGVPGIPTPPRFGQALVDIWDRVLSFRAELSLAV